MYMVFCRLSPFSPQPPRQCLGPTALLLTSTVSPVRACLHPYDWRGFEGPKKKTSSDLLVFNPLWVGGSNSLYVSSDYYTVV
jgi:hypothetical protein